jgi:radical SAM superfamily enzyme YgiQ (UPF0313 family)
MELLSRPKNDRYTKPGQYRELESSLRTYPEAAEIPCLVTYAFDFRTRLGPFLFTDMKLLTAGPRAVAAALYSSGFTKTRIVQRQWNPNLRPSEARFDGQPPQMLFVSSMQIHSASAYEMITDAYKLGDERPFILAGGAKAIYEPYDFFGIDPERKISADVACTGEEYVILELLERIMSHRGTKEHPRKTFHRLRRSGLLDDIPGLVFREGDEKAPLGRLVNTGIQRMVQDLDELPHPIVGLGLLEQPHRRHQMGARPVPLERLGRYGGIIGLVTTHGCKFHCSYCPIPAYNQFTFRWKSPERLRDEIEVIGNRTKMDYFFGTDDNLFNNRETVEELFTELAKGKVRGKSLRERVFFGTEATEYDVFKNADLLPLCYEGGMKAIWFGIEDMTAELVKKGQTPEKTQKLFQIMNKVGIAPMSMMMHHDGQPLASRGNLYGLLNQVRFLHKSGSVSMQVTILTPSVGSKGYEQPYEDGMVIEAAGKHKLEDYLYDGNHCIATKDPNPWKKQINVFLAYASFYNPVNFGKIFLKRNDPLKKYRVMWQIYGMLGVVKSFIEASSWVWNLYKGPIRKLKAVPKSVLPMVSADEPEKVAAKPKLSTQLVS